MTDQNLQNQDWLFKKGIITEQPFSSEIPILGPIIVWFRTMWNSVAAKWYVRPLLEQQNNFNRLIVERVRDIEAYAYDLSTEQDRDLSRLRHDVAALHLQLTQLNQQLAEINDHLEQKDTVGQGNGDQGET
jgi:hypothetical protein